MSRNPSASTLESSPELPLSRTKNRLTIALEQLLLRNVSRLESLRCTSLATRGPGSSDPQSGRRAARSCRGAAAPKTNAAPPCGFLARSFCLLAQFGHFVWSMSGRLTILGSSVHGQLEKTCQTARDMRASFGKCQMIDSSCIHRKFTALCRAGRALGRSDPPAHLCMAWVFTACFTHCMRFLTEMCLFSLSPRQNGSTWMEHCAGLLQLFSTACAWGARWAVVNTPGRT